MIVSAITVYAVIIIFWCITYLIPQNELHNPKYHHGLDTDYKDLKGDALANAKVRDSVVMTFQTLSSYYMKKFQIFLLHFYKSAAKTKLF